MATMETMDERVELLGRGWIRAITEGAPDRLQEFCQPDIASSVLTPKRYVNLDNVADLVAKYRLWFGECTDFQVLDSRVGMVGDRLGIFYSLYLQEHGDWYRIEQQLYGTLRDGRVERLHLLCSGFRLVAVGDPGPDHDDLLEFHTKTAEAGSTCAVLTPMIKSRLNGLQSGQVLEVRVDDRSARGDVEAWTRLSGNTLLKVMDGKGELLRFFVQKK